jgi:biotin-(acetyl-CoA carboxylase) ligase
MGVNVTNENSFANLKSLSIETPSLEVLLATIVNEIDYYTQPQHLASAEFFTEYERYWLHQ